MQEMFSKLSSYAALLGVIGALDAKIEELKAEQDNPLLN